MFVTLVAISVTLFAMSVSLELMLDAFVEMFVVLVVTFDELSLISDSTSEIEPKVNVPSISASFRIVTVPEV